MKHIVFYKKLKVFNQNKEVMDTTPFCPPSIEHIEIRYRYVKTDVPKIDRTGVSIVECLTKELGLKGNHAVYWGKYIMDSLYETFNTSPHFWQHIQIDSRAIWEKAQAVRRIVGTENARFFTNNMQKAFADAIQARGYHFNKKFSHLYTTWIHEYNNYIVEPSYAIFRSVTIPTEDSMWYVTIQLYPSIFYEDKANNSKLWRKGGIKFEQLVLVEGVWDRDENNYLNAITCEIAWYASDGCGTLFVPAQGMVRMKGVHELVDTNIVQKLIESPKNEEQKEQQKEEQVSKEITVDV